ncbi:hypothetical protein AAFC00_004919 [Neodothiora populina]|uniref:Up-regulated during septation protein 1 domain-containing protein n=1 Tax=Neodothiora populina TaxID=2781224 RepID=A0ABR3P3Y9_9PEZI
MQLATPPSQVHRPAPLNGILGPHEFPSTSFLDNPSTPGYSDSDWKNMAPVNSGISNPSNMSNPSAFSPTFSSPGPRPLTPKTDSFSSSDVVSKHLLVETALLDSSKFDILPIDEVDSLKKEKQKVDARIESARRKLAMEHKVRDAAQSLHRLYSGKGQPKVQRRPSLFGGGARDRTGSGGSTNSNNSNGSNNHGQTANQAEDELSSSVKKIDELVQILIGLENRRQYVESRLLRHTAAVLQAAHGEREAEMSQSLQDSGFSDKDYDDSIFDRVDDMQGLRLHKSEKRLSGSRATQNTKQLSDVNLRLQMLNGQLRSLISQAKRGRSGSVDSNSPDDIPSAYPEDEDASLRLDRQLEHMQDSIITLLQEHKHMKESREASDNKIKHDLHALEGRIETANSQLYNIVSTSTSAAADAQNMYDLHPPPEATGQGAHEQMAYLEETLLTVEQIMQQSDHIRDSHDYLSKEMEDLRVKHDGHRGKAAHYETTVTGLWDILSSDDPNQHAHDDSDDEDGESRSGPPVKESFTLPAFSNKVQHLFERVTHLDRQNDTLRRQIQQQRDLAGKAEADETSARELEDAKVREQEALHELEEHRSRLEQLQDHIAELEAAISDHQDDARIAETEMQAKDHEYRERLAELTSSLEDANAAREKAEGLLSDKEAEMIELESEVVRLSTELTMARAELDGAYGSRGDRAKDVANNPEIQAQLSRLEQLNKVNQSIVAELEQLRMEKLAQGNELQDLMARHQDLQMRSATMEEELSAALTQAAASAKDDSRTRALEKELRDMTSDYQELTRETIEVEKEREKVERVVDALRERVETLESQLSDEKMRWLGVNRVGTPEPGAREMTSTMVMRTEFKKMMREARAEGVRALRVEQEARRRLEADMRTLRREKTPGAALSPNLARAS